MLERTLCVLVAHTELMNLTLRKVQAVAYLAQAKGVNLGLHFWYDLDGPWSKRLSEAIHAGEMSGLVAVDALGHLKTSASCPFVLAANQPSDVDLQLAEVLLGLVTQKNLCQKATRHYRRVLEAAEAEKRGGKQKCPTQ